MINKRYYPSIENIRKIWSSLGFLQKRLEVTSNKVDDLENLIPTPPESGTYILRSVDGVLEWYSE